MEANDDLALKVLADTLERVADQMPSLGLGVGITLVLGGAHLCGTATSRKRYIELVSEAVKRTGDVAESFATSIVDGHTQVVDRADGPEWLYLADVYRFGDRPPVPGAGGAYRVRRDRIDAWSFGTAQPA